MYSSYCSLNSLICKGAKAPTASIALLTLPTIANAGYLTGIISNDGVHICYTQAGGNNNVYYSSNGGASWSTSTGITTTNDLCMMSSDTTGQYILMVSSTSNTKPYYSTNYGASFSQPSAFPSSSSGWWGAAVGEVSGSYPAYLCFGCQTALYVSTNNGSTVSSNKIGTFKINGMASVGSRIVCCQDTNSNTNNVVLSTNSGSTFALMSPQITYGTTSYGRDCAIGYDGTNMRVLYSGISSNSTWLYNGSTWAQLSGSQLNTGDDFPSGVDCSDSGKLMTIVDKTNLKGYYSTDYGVTWSNLSVINSAFGSYQIFGMMCSCNGKYILGQRYNNAPFLVTFPTTN